MFVNRFKKVCIQRLDEYSPGPFFISGVDCLSWDREIKRKNNIYDENSMYVEIGKFAVAEIIFRENDLYGVWIYYEEVGKIPDQWFYKDWLYFIEALRDIGYGGDYINRDKFLVPVGRFLGLFDTFFIKC